MHPLIFGFILTVGLSAFGCSSAPPVAFPTDSEAANAPNPALSADQEVAQKNGTSATPKIIPGLIAQKVVDANPEDTQRFHQSQCPLLDRGETELDCPWAGMTRTIERGEAVNTVIESRAPQLLESLREDQKEKTWLALWGKSTNWDEGVKKTILDHRIIDAFTTPAGYPPQVVKSPREMEIMHAGIAHTYGYLFSNLQTAFGFKRKRWIGHEMEDALRISPGVFGPNPKFGTLFGNVTYFAANVAFRQHPNELLTLETLKSRVSSELDLALIKTLDVHTLLESPSGAPGWTFQTDIIKFQNAGILIYSIHHEPTRLHRLITIFPIQLSFGESLLDPAKLGANQPIQLRYNAYVDRLYGKTFKGERTVISGNTSNL